MSLRLWLPLKGNLDNYGLDNSILIKNNGAIVSSNGKIGSCYDLTSGQKYIKCTNILNIPINSWSLSCWCYPTERSSSSHQYIFGMNTDTSNDFLGMLCWYGNKFSIRTGGTTYQNSVTSPRAVWYHIAATYDGTDLKLYVDGQCVLTRTSPASPKAATTAWVGVRGDVAGRFFGKINDARIYDHCLSEKEVEEISKGLILHYKLDDPYLEGAANEFIQDSSGYNNNGTTLGTLSVNTDTPRYDYSTVFNGINTAIACGRKPMVTDAITVSCWVYKQTWINQAEYYISCLQSGGWGIYINPSYGLRFLIRASSSGYIIANSSISPQNLTSGWHLFTGTFNGKDAKFYIDGELVGQGAASSKQSISYHETNGIFIGAESETSETTPIAPYFDGKISDVRIYAVALTEKQIKELYNISVSIDKSGNVYARELIEK